MSQVDLIHEQPFDSLELMLLAAWRSEAEEVLANECGIGQSKHPVIVAARGACLFTERNYLDARYTVPLNEKLADRRRFCQRLVADGILMARPRFKQLVVWDWAAEFFDGNTNNRRRTDAEWIRELVCDRRSYFRNKHGHRRNGRIVSVGAMTMLEAKMFSILDKVKADAEARGFLVGRMPGMVGVEMEDSR